MEGLCYNTEIVWDTSGTNQSSLAGIADRFMESPRVRASVGAISKMFPI